MPRANCGALDVNEDRIALFLGAAGRAEQRRCGRKVSTQGVFERGGGGREREAQPGSLPSGGNGGAEVLASAIDLPQGDGVERDLTVRVTQSRAVVRQPFRPLERTLAVGPPVVHFASHRRNLEPRLICICRGHRVGDRFVQFVQKREGGIEIEGRDAVVRDARAQQAEGRGGHLRSQRVDRLAEQLGSRRRIAGVVELCAQHGSVCRETFEVAALPIQVSGPS